MSGRDPVLEGERIMTICNACRYCEGYCAVFPAMERRLEFTAGDMNYLANLCHDCGECYYACQYAPPHEFDVNVPRTLAEIRVRSYRQYAWPAPLAALFDGNALAASIVLAVSLVLWLVAGGLLYTVGAVIYAGKRLNFVPGLFGSHEVWHLFVTAAAAAHYVLILRYVA